MRIVGASDSLEGAGVWAIRWIVAGRDIPCPESLAILRAPI